MLASLTVLVTLVVLYSIFLMGCVTGKYLDRQASSSQRRAAALDELLDERAADAAAADAGIFELDEVCVRRRSEHDQSRAPSPDNGGERPSVRILCAIPLS